MLNISAVYLGRLLTMIDFFCRGVVALDIDIRRMVVDQCANGIGAFSNTHHCRDTTEVRAVLIKV